MQGFPHARVSSCKIFLMEGFRHAKVSPCQCSSVNDLWLDMHGEEGKKLQVLRIAFALYFSDIFIIYQIKFRYNIDKPTSGLHT